MSCHRDASTLMHHAGAIIMRAVAYRYQHSSKSGATFSASRKGLACRHFPAPRSFNA